MPLIQLIVLALIQGITEFLPISSSAHLILAPLVVESWADQGPLIDVAAHVGSLAAVLAYFRSETACLFRGAFDTLAMKASDDRRLFFLIAAATAPFLLIAPIFVVTGLVEAVRSPVVIGWASIIFGAVLWHADRRPAADRALSAISWRHAMLIGAAQAIAVVPGASRSGITMTAARYLGWSRPDAARFSMLLAIPAILASGLFAGITLATDGAQATVAAAFIVAALSFVAAFVTIALFMRLTQRVSFTPFVIYRLAMGVLLLIFAGKLGHG